MEGCVVVQLWLSGCEAGNLLLLFVSGRVRTLDDNR